MSAWQAVQAHLFWQCRLAGYQVPATVGSLGPNKVLRQTVIYCVVWWSVNRLLHVWRLVVSSPAGIHHNFAWRSMIVSCLSLHSLIPRPLGLSQGVLQL